MSAKMMLSFAAPPTPDEHGIRSLAIILLTISRDFLDENGLGTLCTFKRRSGFARQCAAKITCSPPRTAMNLRHTFKNYASILSHPLPATHVKVPPAPWASRRAPGQGHSYLIATPFWCPTVSGYGCSRIQNVVECILSRTASLLPKAFNHIAEQALLFFGQKSHM